MNPQPTSSQPSLKQQVQEELVRQYRRETDRSDLYEGASLLLCLLSFFCLLFGTPLGTPEELKLPALPGGSAYYFYQLAKEARKNANEKLSLLMEEANEDSNNPNPDAED
jgi:hypothetical protein